MPGFSTAEHARGGREDLSARDTAMAAIKSVDGLGYIGHTTSRPHE